MTEPSVEILLVQRDQHHVEKTLDVLRTLNLARAIHVVRDGSEALEFLRGNRVAGTTPPPGWSSFTCACAIRARSRCSRRSASIRARRRSR